MKQLIGLVGAGMLLLTAGCEVHSGYGYGYGGALYGEYPYTTYYGESYGYPYHYVHPRPYDRDHYWDRDRHRERRRWHGDDRREHEHD